MSKNQLIRNIGYLIVLFLVTASVKLYIADVFYIPSSSMENCLYEGDRILVNKLTQKVMSGSVLVFSNANKSGYLVKRCLGLPDDSLKSVNGKMYINGISEVSRTSVKQLMDIWLTNSAEYQQIERIIGFDQVYARELSLNKITANCTSLAINMLLKETQIDSITKNKDFFDQPPLKFRKVVQRTGSGYPDITPIWVPEKGRKIRIGEYLLDIYVELIQQENEVNFDLDSLWHSGEYTFKHNYYYMVGDNRDFSRDSRVSGFVREDQLVGEVVLLVFSSDWKGFHWDRILKLIS